MAKSLRRKVVDVEEYLENNQTPLNPEQRKRLKCMNKGMRDQLGRMKQAWRVHNDADKLDDAYTLEIAKIVNNAEDEVQEKNQGVKKIHEHIESLSLSCRNDRRYKWG